MLRLSTFSCILLYVFLCTLVHQFVFFISYVGCFRCLSRGSQVLLMAPVATLVIQLRLHGSFICPQDSQLPQEALAQVLLPIMWLKIGLSLSFYGMLCHMVSLSWKSDQTLNWWFPSSINLIRCETLFYYVSSCKLGYWKEILKLLYSITFHEIRIH